MIDTGLRMNADELLRLRDDGKRYELIAGELHEMSPAGFDRGLVTLEASFWRRLFLREHPEVGGAFVAAETGFRLSGNPDTVRAPDIGYVSATRLAQARGPGYADLVPDLVVEVASPGDRASEVQAKADEWLRAGALLVWVLYPTTQSAMVYQVGGAAQLLHADDTLTGDPVLPGFACRFGDLFGLAQA